MNLTNFTITNFSYPVDQVVDMTKCSIDESKLFAFMHHYPQWIFWGIGIAFLALVLHLYLPYLFKSFNRPLGWQGVMLENLFTVCFMFLGIAFLAMIPIAFSLDKSALLKFTNVVSIGALVLAPLAIYRIIKMYKKEKK